MKKRGNDTQRTMMASLWVRVGPRPWNDRLPSTSANATSEITNKRTAWVSAPTMDRKMKSAIFSRKELSSSVRKTARTETVGGVSTEVDDRVLEKGLFTGSVSAGGRA